MGKDKNWKLHYCHLENQGQIISTGGAAFGKEFSNVWIFNNKEEVSLIKETQMKQKRYNHGCGIFYRYVKFLVQNFTTRGCLPKGQLNLGYSTPSGAHISNHYNQNRVLDKISLQ